jgi:DNA-binding LacI/PurR family transcriptional regulator
MAADQIVVEYLYGLANQAHDGQKVPTVRYLMKQFGLSQLVVQRALTLLKGEGRIRAEIGRGTFFCLPEGVATEVDSERDASSLAGNILFLRRSVSAGYGRAVLYKLEDMLRVGGSKVLEVSYNDAEHARLALQSLPAFDACVVQSSFEPISIETLSAIREKAPFIILHGLGLTGTEVDCVGHDWGSSVSRALRMLSANRHERIGFATTNLQFMSNLMGVRRFQDWCEEHDQNSEELLISLPMLIHDGFARALVEGVKAKRSKSGKLPFTALICWGVEQHSELLECLSDANIRVPEDLSVVLLGGPDDAQAQASVFTTLGSTSDAQANGIFKSIQARLTKPNAPAQVRFLPVDLFDGASISNKRR